MRAHLMTLEMGKPIKVAVGEAAKCATDAAIMPKMRKSFLADEVVETRAKEALSDINRSARCWQSCRGIFRSGRYSASLRPR